MGALTSRDAVDPVTTSLGARPGKIVAVHLNYHSRAAQRGRVPAEPSYFLKPGSSLSAAGIVERPLGTELLTFEGEVALVIGRQARGVRPEDGWHHVGWVTAANDLGLQDLRAADRGANVRSKGSDGFTPIGPTLLDARHVDPAALRIRTWLDGTLVQDDTTASLLFDFGLLVADLSRTITLDVGDVILTGTPAGASVAMPGQRIEVEVCSLDESLSSGRLRTDVVDAAALAEWGAPPLVDDAQRADAWGTPAPATASLSDAVRERLGRVAVATLSVQLRKLGYETSTIDGVRPLVPGRRLVGTARTLRYVPFRPDLYAERGNGFTPQKRAIDSVGAGEVLVMEARGDTSAGTLGDILALRAQVRGAAGLITDGSVRDSAALAALDLPVFAGGVHPAVLGRRHVPWDTDVTICCGGATVQVGDVLVADDDGALVIPPALVEQVLSAAEAQEAEEAWILEQVRSGHGVEGLYPLSGDWRARYDAEAVAGEGTEDGSVQA